MSIDQRYVDYVIESANISDDDMYNDIGVAWNENQYMMLVEHHKKNNLPPPPIGAMGYGTEFGKKFYSDCQDKLKEVLCDPKKGKPKSSLANLIDSDYKDLAVALITMIATTLETTVAIATPIAALCLKYGLNRFCSK